MYTPPPQAGFLDTHWHSRVTLAEFIETLVSAKDWSETAKANALKRIRFEIEAFEKSPPADFLKHVPLLTKLVNEISCPLPILFVKTVWMTIGNALSQTPHPQLEEVFELSLVFIQRAQQEHIEDCQIGPCRPEGQTGKAFAVAAVIFWPAMVLDIPSVKNQSVDHFVQLLRMPLFQDPSSACNIYQVMRHLQFKASFCYFDLKDSPLIQALRHVLQQNPGPVYLLAYSYYETRRFQMNQSDLPIPFPVTPAACQTILEGIDLTSLDKFGLESILFALFRKRLQISQNPYPLSSDELSFLVRWLEEMYKKNPAWLPGPLLLECPNFDLLWPFIVPRLILPKDDDGPRFAAQLALFHPQLQLPTEAQQKLTNIALDVPHPYVFYACLGFFPKDEWLKLAAIYRPGISLWSNVKQGQSLNNIFRFATRDYIGPAFLGAFLEIFNNLVRASYFSLPFTSPNPQEISTVLEALANQLEDQANRDEKHSVHKIISWKLGRRAFLAFIDTAGFLLQDAEIHPHSLAAHRAKMQQLSTIYLGTDTVINNIKI